MTHRNDSLCELCLRSDCDFNSQSLSSYPVLNEIVVDRGITQLVFIFLNGIPVFLSSKTRFVFQTQRFDAFKSEPKDIFLLNYFIANKYRFRCREWSESSSDRYSVWTPFYIRSNWTDSKTLSSNFWSNLWSIYLCLKNSVLFCI